MNKYIHVRAILAFGLLHSFSPPRSSVEAVDLSIPAFAATPSSTLTIPLLSTPALDDTLATLTAPGPDFSETPFSTLTVSLPFSTAVADTTTLAAAAARKTPQPQPQPKNNKNGVIGLRGRTAPTPGPRSFASDAAFQRACLNATSAYRRQHGAAELAWDATLAGAASAWSQQCEFRASGAGGGAYGETLSAGHADAGESVGAWAAQEGRFRALAEGTGGGFGGQQLGAGGVLQEGFEASQFAQLVWKGSARLGCARTNCAGRNGVAGWLVVCEFAPRGNVPGQYAQNVQAKIQGRAGGRGLIGNVKGGAGDAAQGELGDRKGAAATAAGSRLRSEAGRTLRGNGLLRGLAFGVVTTIIAVLS